jgi:hypothetical protein
MGSNASVVTDHAGLDIMMKHYIDKEEILTDAGNKMKFLDDKKE